jgi:hypothetical protein
MLHDVVQDLRSSHGCGRICTHTASVEPNVPFSDALVILRCWQGNDSVAVRKGQDRDLGAVEQFLDTDLVSCPDILWIETVTRRQGQ